VGNIKNRAIKPAGSFNYAEGIKVKASEAIATNDIVIIQGVSGGIAVVSLADAATAAGVKGRVLISKHAIPSGGYGVALPWKIVEGIDTAAFNSNAGALGDIWAIGEGATSGAIIDPNAAAPTVSRPIAITVSVSSGAGAKDGAYLVDTLSSL
tara:strand:+ start:117 stop:575 length:459 start_codon:yes stop_codon:yes gene_type:complete